MRVMIKYERMSGQDILSGCAIKVSYCGGSRRVIKMNCQDVSINM